ncbi:hypothetical protein F4778DRAFT_726939 [Xylariomycetidae sp. FL2044]|nr:hypothetical protein F4778DRAFT_726939 [Xylariomycetidae sp. FL2044]
MISSSAILRNINKNPHSGLCFRLFFFFHHTRIIASCEQSWTHPNNPTASVDADPDRSMAPKRVPYYPIIFKRRLRRSDAYVKFVLTPVFDLTPEDLAKYPYRIALDEERFDINNEKRYKIKDKELFEMFKELLPNDIIQIAGHHRRQEALATEDGSARTIVFYPKSDRWYAIYSRNNYDDLWDRPGYESLEQRSAPGEHVAPPLINSHYDELPDELLPPKLTVVMKGSERADNGLYLFETARLWCPAVFNPNLCWPFKEMYLLYASKVSSRMLVEDAEVKLVWSRWGPCEVDKMWIIWVDVEGYEGYLKIPPRHGYRAWPEAVPGHPEHEKWMKENDEKFQDRVRWNYDGVLAE